MRQHKGPHRIRIDGPVVALALPFDRFVAVQPEHQHIALRLAAFQQIHMPRMQDVVTPVGEDDFFAFPAQGIQFFQQLGHIGHAGMFQHIHCSSLCRRERRFPEAAALSVPRDVFRFSQSRIACSGRSVSCPSKAERSLFSKAPLRLVPVNSVQSARKPCSRRTVSAGRERTRAPRS